MKTHVIKTTLLGIALAVNLGAFAQKKNVVNAIMDYTSYEKAISSQNFAGAKKSLLSAKSNIDLAAENAETAQDLKMLFNKGRIYMGLAVLASIDADDQELQAFANEVTLQTGLDSWKMAYELDAKNKFRDDIKQQIFMITGQSSSLAGNMFSDGKYDDAYQIYASNIALYDVINKDVPGYGATAFNAGLSAERSEKYDEAFKFYELAATNGYEEANSFARAANVLISAGKNDEAMKYIVAANDKFPGDGKIIETMAVISLKTGQDELAIASLNQAIAKDPGNSVYHWAIGTVYQKSNKDDMAIASFLKATELNPKDDRPYYSIGTLYFNKAVDITEQANKLKLGDPQFDVLEAEAKEQFRNAAPYLEKVLDLQGDENNQVLLNNLFTIHRKLGDSEKALEFKKRSDALK